MTEDTIPVASAPTEDKNIPGTGTSPQDKVALVDQGLQDIVEAISQKPRRKRKGDERRTSHLKEGQDESSGCENKRSL